MEIKPLSLFRDARLVKAAVGKGLLRQMFEIVGIKRRNPTLGATDYFSYRLYDSRFLGSSRPEDFLGWRVQTDLAEALNVRNVVMAGWDKFTLTIFANAYGFPIPRLRAYYRPGSSPAVNMARVTLSEPDQLSDWIRNANPWPVFAKPSYSQLGLGCFCFVAYSSQDDSILTRDGGRIPVARFVNDIVCRPTGPYYEPSMGYLFQEVLRPHARIRDLLGNETISGVRIVVAQDGASVVPIAALWKMATGANDIDNTRGYSTGNLTGEIDMGSGSLGRVLDGYWPKAKVVKQSPDTQKPFDGFVIPYWIETIDLCKRAAHIFPLMRLQYWDIAITDAGPTIIELNDMGSIQGPQLWGRGLRTPEVAKLLHKYANAKRFSWASKIRE